MKPKFVAVVVAAVVLIAASVTQAMTWSPDPEMKLVLDALASLGPKPLETTHEFFGMGAVVPDAKEAVRFAGDRLKAAFARGE